MRFSIWILAGSLAVAGLSVDALGASAPADLKQQIQNPSLDLSRAVELRNLTIELGGGVFEVDQGVLVPGRPISGRVMEMVFVGKALFRLTPPNEIEAHQLELFTQQETLGTGIDGAVFVLGNASITSRLLDRSAATLDSATKARLMVGRFVPLEMDDREKHDRERALRMARKGGRGIHSRLEDLGVWDTWMRMSLRDETGRSTPGSNTFEPKHYDLEAKLDPKVLRMEGKATLHLMAVREGSRAVALDLFEDLTPSSIRDGAGHDLPWYRSGAALHVMLADPVHKNDSITLEVKYSGVIFNGLGGESVSLRDTQSWYPHCGTIDRATYKLTLRWPKKYQVMASGKVIESRQENKEQVETRVLEVPADEVSFEVGEFDVIEQQVGHVKMSVAVWGSGLVTRLIFRSLLVPIVLNTAASAQPLAGDEPSEAEQVVVLGDFKGRLAFQPSGPFVAAIFHEDALGDYVGVIYWGVMGDPLVGKWRLEDRFWQVAEWSSDATGIAWGPSGKYLYVATGGVYGTGAVYRLDLMNRSAKMIFPSSEYLKQGVHVTARESTILGVDKPRNALKLQFTSSDLRKPLIKEVPFD